MLGYADDLDSVEELFTSSRTAAFGRAFLTAFAVRIGQRLRVAVDVAVTVAAAESGVALVPILAARSEAVEALARETFPHSRPLRATVTDADGWHAGTAFADEADLAVHSKLARGA